MLRIRDPRSEIRHLDSGINISDHISESLVTLFWIKNTLILCPFGVADPYPGWKNPDPAKHPGSATFKELNLLVLVFYYIFFLSFPSKSVCSFFDF